MPKRDKKHLAYRDVPPKYGNEPEEGEIVDDYDLIVSSDEELSMRQRILELEAKNEEIEQIAVISRCYVDKLKNNRAAQVPTDVSSISSTEFVTPQKRKRRKSKERKKKHCHRQHPQEHSYQYDQPIQHEYQKLPQKTHSKKAHCKRRKKLFAKKHKNIQSDRFIQNDAYIDTLSLESLGASDSSSITDDNNSCNWLTSKRKEDAFNKRKYITRKTLRMAVERNTTISNPASNKYCLKDKLLRQELVGQPSKNYECKYIEGLEILDDNEDDDVQVIENEPIIQTIDEDSTDSMEEKELRLIALKSAVLKKHMARKIRNAEVAYSPTDFDEILSCSILNASNKMDDTDIIDLEAEDSQSACVTISPEASPQLKMLDDHEESQQMVDCKPIDMDIANSDSEDATIDSWSKDVDPCLQKCSPELFDFVENIQYKIYMQSLHELPPPPPGVDDYDNVPPPPPYHMHFCPDEVQDMDVDEEFTEGQQRLVDKEIYASQHKETKDETELTVKSTDYRLKCDVEDGEEEEIALRALLLSKFQSPKTQKKLDKPKEEGTNDKDALEIDEFCRQNQCKPKPTEIILKEAVKRLKIHSQTEMCKKEENVNSFVEENTKPNETPPGVVKNNTEYSFEKLRDRLNQYKNPSHSNTDQRRHGTTEQHLSESCNEVSNDQNVIPNSFELTNRIDISDITRRLQKIKENVLNSTHKINTKTHPASCDSIPKVMRASHSQNENIENLENVQGLHESPTQDLCPNQLNNFVNNVSDGDMNEVIARNKTVEANFDTNTNQTTFKVTIKNIAAANSEENNIVNTFNDIEKDNDNCVPKNLPLKIIGNTFKTDLSRKKVIQIPNHVTRLNAVNMAPVNEPLSIIKPTVSDKVSSNTKYSLLRATKIVKPNKIINKNFELKQKHISKATESALISKSQKSEENVKLTESLRLITSIEQVKYMYKIPPFVITLQDSSNDSSEEEMMEDYNSLYKPLYDYNDNTSPLSLNLESPSTTPLRSNSPIDINAEGVIDKSNLDSLNLATKLPPKHKEQITVAKSPYSLKLNKTPLAVRHLPAEAQSEYRKLVHRMKLLENKRKLTNREENISNEQNNSSVSHPDNEGNKEKVQSDSGNSLAKSSLVKKVLIKNASNNKTLTTPNKTFKTNRSNCLRSYENFYIKLGEGIVNNLDKLLMLVDEAKAAKIAKLKLENRLKELKAEMDILQHKHKEEQQKISRIYPSVCSTNDVITTLKQKRSKMYKNAVNLGKTIQGDAYRLNNDLKEIITTKSKKLATEIKTVNSLKAQNIKSVEDVMNKTPRDDQQLEENIKKKYIKDCTTNTEEANVEIEINTNKATNNNINSSERCDENGAENTPEPILKSDIGGNTEFQEMDTIDSISQQNTEDSCIVDPPDTKLNKTSLEMDSEETKFLSSYISPLAHFRNIDSNMDPNGVVCPYDLMGNCEDVTCKYVHITPKPKT